MLQFLGTGSAFNTERGNTSAFIRRGDSLLLIDCGGMVFHRLLERKLLEGVKHLRILITHTHPDHAGSLGEVIFHSHFLSGCRPILHFPDRALMTGFLAAVGVTPEMAELIDEPQTSWTDPNLGEVTLAYLEASHVDTIPAWSLLLTCEGERIYYSGDANAIPPVVLERLENGTLDRIYQDTCGLDYEGNAHLSLARLTQAIPEPLRAKVYCMHFDKHVDLEEIQRLGFQVVHV